MDLEVHSLEIKPIVKVDGTVDSFVRDTTDWKSGWSRIYFR